MMATEVLAARFGKDAAAGWFGLDRGEVEPLLRRLRPGQDDAPSLLREAFARSALSGIAEPGDRIAGAAVQSLGGAATLAWLLSEARDTLPDGIGVTSEEWGAAIARWQPRLSARHILRALQSAVSVKASLVLPADAAWPSGLDDLGEHAPQVLWLRGNADLLPAQTANAVAIVGTRAATGYGEYVAAELASGLAGSGVATVSGGAYGIDGVVHRASLAAEVPTVAVLAGGIDRLYPAGHEQLLRRIAEDGVVIAETLPGTSPSRWRFLQRNRIIAALAHTVAVIEAGVRSGALNTTAHAVALGRTVAAVPGPVTSAASAGTHRLIRDFDAALVTSSRDLLALLPGRGDEPATLIEEVIVGDAVSGDSSDTEQAASIRVLDAMSERSRRSIEQISAASGLAVDVVRSVLGLLLIEGVVDEAESGWRKRARRSE